MQRSRLEITPGDRQQAFLAVTRPTLLQDHLARLRSLPAHGNRKLHYDQLFLGLLLAFFDPLVRSLRTIEDQKDFHGRLDLDRLARSTTADALAVFDPAHLKPIIDDLRAKVPGLMHAADGGDLHQIAQRIIAADGTYLTTLSEVAWALRHTRSDKRKQAQVRLNVQLDVSTWTPEVVTVSGDDGQSEAAAFAPDLLPGVLYVVDRNFVDFGFIAAVLEKPCDLVLRVRDDSPKMKTVRKLPVSARDAEAGVVEDRRVILTGESRGKGGKRGRAAPTDELRCVTIRTTGRDGKETRLRLLTTLGEEVPGWTVGEIYRMRWQIELFFKWLKTWARMDHLLSTSRRGITFQFYVAVIAVLMMYVQSGQRVSIYALSVLGSVARGTMKLEQALEVIARRARERELERARQARLRARKKLG